ncbi:MAG: hypothetical protein KDB27_22165, partial [Planctomycetales bacterium]|nr:hypothetical protein [Planctomycetales bacterium]
MRIAHHGINNDAAVFWPSIVDRQGISGMDYLDWLRRVDLSGLRSRICCGRRKPQRPADEQGSFYITRLEERCVLNADFTAVAGALTLNAFASNTDLTIHEVDNGGTLEYEFVLTKGNWNGTDIPSNVVANNATLTVSRSFAKTILVDDTGSKDPNIFFDSVDFSLLDDTNSMTIRGVSTITQSAAPDRVIIEDLTIDNAGSVQLTNDQNDFNTVSILSGNVLLADVDEIEFGVISLTGNFDLLTDGNISQTASATVLGYTAINAATGDVTLADPTNSFLGEVSITTQGSATFENSLPTTFGAIDVDGTLDLTAAGDITQTLPWSVVQTTTISSGGLVDLSAGNTLQDVITVTTNGDFTLFNSHATTVLGAVDVVSGSLTIDAFSGGISQTAPWNVDFGTTLVANTSVQLGTEANVLGPMFTILIDAGDDVALRNTTATSANIAVRNGGDLTLDIASDLFQATPWLVTGNATITGASIIDLSSSGNLFDGQMTLNAAGVPVTVRNESTTAGRYTVPLAVDDLTITHTNAGVEIGPLSVANSLTISSRDDITQTGAWTVGGNTSLDITGTADILLDAFDNDLAGPAAITSTIASKDIRLRNTSTAPGALTIGTALPINDLQIDYPNADVVIPSVDAIGNLTVTSRGAISASGILNIGGSTSLTTIDDNADILLGDAAGHVFDGSIDVSTLALTLGQVRLTSLTATSPIAVDIHQAASATNINFPSANVLLDFVSTNNLDVVAFDAIQQSGQWDVNVATNLSLNAVGTIDIDDFANTFDGALSMFYAPDSSVHYRNASTTAPLPLFMNTLQNLTVIMDSADATLPAIVVSGDLVVESDRMIAEAGIWSVSGATLLRLTDSGSIFLGAQTHSFASPVKIDTVFPATVGSLEFRNTHVNAQLVGLPQDISDLLITYDNAPLQLPATTVFSNLQLTASGGISQSGSLIAFGPPASFTLTAAGDILLTEANQFNIAPTFNGTIGHLSYRNVLASATMPALPVGLTDLTIEFDTAAVVLPTITLTGQLSVDAGGSITQSGPINVSDLVLSTTTTANVVLDDVNTITGTVSLDGSIQDVSLTNTAAVFPSINFMANVRDLDLTYPSTGITVTPISISGQLTLNSNGMINQFGPINAAGFVANVTAANSVVDLTFGTNDLGSNILIGVSGAGSITDVLLTDASLDPASVTISPTITNLVLDFAGAVALNTLVTTDLSVTSQGLSQTGQLIVLGATTLSGVSNSDMLLASQANDFQGAITIGGSVNDVQLRNQNNFAVAPSFLTPLNSFMLQHDTTTISLPAISLTGSLDLTSHGTISQTGVWDIGGTSSLKLTLAGDILLGTEMNDFANNVSITGAVNSLQLRNINGGANVSTLPLSNLADLFLTFDNAGVDLPAATILGNMTLNMNGDVTQSGSLSIGGITTINLISPSDVLLADFGNFFANAVNVTGIVNNVEIRNSSATAIAPTLSSIPTGYTLIHDAAQITLAPFQVNGDLVITSNGSIGQTGAVIVNGNSTFTVTAPNSDVLLNLPTNVFDGAVTVGATGIGSLNDVHIATGVTSFSVALTALASSLIVDGPVTSSLDLGTIVVTNDLAVTSNGTITQSGAWSVGGNTTVTSNTGDVLANSQLNSIQQVLFSTPGTFALSSDSDVVLVALTTPSGFDVVSQGAITGDGLDSTGVARFITENDAGRPITLTNSKFSGPVTAEVLNATA